MTETAGPSFGLLSRLWLAEPDARALDAVRAIGPLSSHVASVGELSAAYTELFLLNVYPYGTVFTDPSGELNAPGAKETVRRCEEAGYRPAELLEVGAPDHAGLGLGLLAHLEKKGERDAAFLSILLDWLPACCLAVERDPAAHPFYRSLAVLTRERLLENIGFASAPPAEPPEVLDAEEVIGLRDVVRYLIAPARSGVFLSRARLGRISRSAGLQIPFGSRWDVAETLFSAAGESGRVPDVLTLLEEEAAGWAQAFVEWSEDCPCWGSFADRWLARIAKTRQRLAGMQKLALLPLDLEPAEERLE
jgi:TorA maturation chaperone TorD